LVTKPKMKAKIASLIVVATTLISTGVSYGQKSVAPATPIDATLYTTYNIGSTQISVTWFTCGSTQNTSGCYGGGDLGLFGKVGALLEGNPKTNLTTNTVTRAIYALDVASGANQDEVVLNVYKKTDVITPDYDTVTVDLVRTVSLPLTGGTAARGLMAANNKFLLIGTSRSPVVVELDKRTLTSSQIGPYSMNLSSVTADQYGYVAAVFGDSGSFLINPDGNIQQSGGSPDFLLNTIQGVPAMFP
jgi:hypothetical protein